MTGTLNAASTVPEAQTATAGTVAAVSGAAGTVDPAADLLDLADAILDGSVAVPGASATRAAAVIARQVLEDAVERRCRELAGTVARPTGRSQLILIRELGDVDVAAKAQTAWDGLSRACHHHSYELQPSSAEVRMHIRAVREISGWGK